MAEPVLIKERQEQLQDDSDSYTGSDVSLEEADIPLPPNENAIHELMCSLLEEQQKASREISACSVEIKKMAKNTEKARLSITAYNKVRSLK